MCKHRDERCPGKPAAAEVESQWVGGCVGDPLAGEQEAKTVMEARGRKDDSDAERA